MDGKCCYGKKKKGSEETDKAHLGRNCRLLQFSRVAQEDLSGKESYFVPTSNYLDMFHRP